MTRLLTVLLATGLLAAAGGTAAHAAGDPADWSRSPSYWRRHSPNVARESGADPLAAIQAMHDQLSRWLWPGSPSSSLSMVHARETDTERLYFVDAPGFTKDDIKVVLEGGRRLKIRAKHECDASDELCVDRFVRHDFGVEDDIDAKKITVNIDAGVLRVHMPKRSATRFHIPVVDSLLGLNNPSTDRAAKLPVERRASGGSGDDDEATEPLRWMAGAKDEAQERARGARDYIRDAAAGAAERARNVAGGMAGDHGWDIMGVTDDDFETPLFPRDVGGQIKEAAGRTSDQVAGAAAHARDAMSDTAGRAKDTVAATAARAKDSVVDTAARAKDTVADAASRARDSAADAAGRARDAMADSLSDAADRARDTAGDAAASARFAALRARDAAKENIFDPAAQAAEGVRDAAEDTSESAWSWLTSHLHGAKEGAKEGAEGAKHGYQRGVEEADATQ